MPRKKYEKNRGNGNLAFSSDHFSSCQSSFRSMFLKLDHCLFSQFFLSGRLFGIFLRSLKQLFLQHTLSNKNSSTCGQLTLRLCILFGDLSRFLMILFQYFAHDTIGTANLLHALADLGRFFVAVGPAGRTFETSCTRAVLKLGAHGSQLPRRCRLRGLKGILQNFSFF